MCESFIILKWKVNGSEDFVNTYKIHKKNNTTILQSEFPEVLIKDESNSNTYSIKFHNIGQFENHAELLWASLIRTYSYRLKETHPELLNKDIILSCVWSNDREKGIYIHNAETAKMSYITQSSLVEFQLKQTIRILTQLSSPFIDIHD